VFFSYAIYTTRLLVILNLVARHNKRLSCKSILAFKKFKYDKYINNNVEFIIEKETYLIKIDNKIKLDLFYKIVNYCRIN